MSFSLTLLLMSIGILTLFIACVVRPTHISSNAASLQQQQQQQRSLRSTVAHVNRNVNSPSQDGIFDVIVLGRGPAGLSAALFSARSGLSVLVLGSDVGALSQAVELDNFPSWSGSPHSIHAQQQQSERAAYSDESIGGPGWLAATKDQAEREGATFGPPGLLAKRLVHQNIAAKSSSRSTIFIVETPNNDINNKSSAYKARSVIIATGSSPRRLNLPNEDMLWGNFIHSCAICDGSHYAAKTVLVVGGGDAAVDAALILSRRSKMVYLVHRREELRASDATNIQAMRRIDNIQILMPFVVSEWIVGRDGNLEMAVLKNADKSEVKKIQVDGAFTMIGSTPNTDWLKRSASYVKLSDRGHMVTDEAYMSVSQKGLLAAGEVADEKYRQAIVAAADGAKAAIETERWLRSTMDFVANNSPTIIKDTVDDEADEASSKVVLVAGKFRTDNWSEDQDDKNPDNCNLTTIECINTVVKRHPVVVFSKPWCPYCHRAIEALGLDGVRDPYIVDLSQHEKEAQMIQSTLALITGRRTVPNVFVGAKSIGGGDETVYLQRTGKLMPLLKSAGAI